MQARQAQDMDAFFTRLTEQLRGKRVFMLGTYHLMYDIAKAGLEPGVRNVFSPGLGDPHRRRNERRCAAG